jgi:hypothetical protein
VLQLRDVGLDPDEALLVRLYPAIASAAARALASGEPAASNVSYNSAIIVVMGASFIPGFPQTDP